MPASHPIQKLTASVTACLIVAWLGGTAGAAGFKTFYWLLFGVWPATAMHALIPDDAIRAVLALPDEDLGGIFLKFLLQRDILTLILALPPLALLPCLVILLAGRQPLPLPLPRRSPFASRHGTKSGTGLPQRAPDSTNNGSAAAGVP